MRLPDYTDKDFLYAEVVGLLEQLISEPSISRQENKTADILEFYLIQAGCKVNRQGNNVWVQSGHSAKRPLILLNSHHDTVKPAAGYSKDPFKPIVEEGKLYGLGSNDAGASLVCLLLTYLSLYKQDLNFDMVFLASAEEEISGKEGVASVLSLLPKFEGAIVGEPTQMKMAVAEKGLMVLDGLTEGKAGHAARNEGVNAIYLAMEDIEMLKNFKFDKESEHLGPVNANVTMIESGTQHNVVPDRCKFVVDVRTTDAYSNEKTLEVLQSKVKSTLIPRSTRLQPSFLPEDHMIRKAAERLGVETFGSPTLSDQALMDFSTCKMGPGDSARSHTPDEFIHLGELKAGLVGYRRLLLELDEVISNT
jgi:acetylornithine deacetylase